MLHQTEKRPWNYCNFEISGSNGSITKCADITKTLQAKPGASSTILILRSRHGVVLLYFLEIEQEMGSSHSSGTDRIDASQRDLRSIISASTTNFHFISSSVTIPTVLVLAGLVFFLHLERRKRLARYRIRCVSTGTLNSDQDKDLGSTNLDDVWSVFGE